MEQQVWIDGCAWVTPLSVWGGEVWVGQVWGGEVGGGRREGGKWREGGLWSTGECRAGFTPLLSKK